MCMARPVPQTTPTNPAPYSVQDSWGAVRSATTGPDGVRRGGYTVNEQGWANVREYGMWNPDLSKQKPRTDRSAPIQRGSGPNLNM